MSEMLEQVARAMWDQRRKWAGNVPIELEEWGDGSIPKANGIIEEASAAIEAMREPPKQMQDAAWETADETVIYWWQTMIDAALNGSKTPSE